MELCSKARSSCSVAVPVPFEISGRVGVVNQVGSWSGSVVGSWAGRSGLAGRQPCREGGEKGCQFVNGIDGRDEGV